MRINHKAAAALAGAVFMVFCVGGCGGKAIMPESFKTLKAKDGSFKIDYPEQWEAEDGGAPGYAWAKFTSGSAEISVDANIVGSLMADIAKSHNPLIHVAGGGQDESPVAVVHEQERESFEEEGGVKEEQAIPVKTNMSDARRSEYAGKKTFGGGIHGYRVTALSPTKRIRVVCQCREGEWEALKPAFNKVIESLGIGTP